MLSIALLALSRITLEPDVSVHDPKTSSWALRGAAPADKVIDITVQIAVEPAGRDALEAAFWAVSEPDNARYGQHLSIGQIAEILAVPEARVERVRNFFLSHGAVEAKPSPYNDVMSVRMSCGNIERALSTRLGSYVHAGRPGYSIIRASEHYSVPDELAGDVHMIGELHQFPALRKPPTLDTVEETTDEHGRKLFGPSGGGGDWPNACDAAGCKGKVTPAVLQKRYVVPKDPTAADMKASMAVAEFQGQHFKPTDIAKFGKSCHVNATVDKEIGGNTPPTAGVEAELDIEYIKGVAEGVPLTVVYVKGEYSLLGWANEITGLDDSPLVHSVSYGNDEKQQTGADYMYSVNTAFMKAGARGLSILFASGDQGVCGREGCGFFGKHRFKPDFPGGSPYHTSVGGTDFLTKDIGEEKVWQDGGGGFSDTFPIPSYQAAMVADFKSNSSAMGLLPPQNLWNNTGRGYPDVAALGGEKAPYCVATSGRFAGVAGTSASSPVVGGIIARLNGVRLAKGGKPLGFLNPFLYKHPEGFHDVTKGMNNANYKIGFTAIAGWDAASGLGTPNFEKLSQVV